MGNAFLLWLPSMLNHVMESLTKFLDLGSNASDSELPLFLAIALKRFWEVRNKLVFGKDELYAQRLLMRINLDIAETQNRKGTDELHTTRNVNWKPTPLQGTKLSTDAALKASRSAYVVIA